MRRYFVDHPDIEPTNNTGEQEIRHGVLFRKTSQGTQSHLDSEFVATILTVRATLRKQERNIRPKTTVRYNTLYAQWYRACGTRLLRVVIVATENGNVPYRVFFSTDASLSVPTIIAR